MRYEVVEDEQGWSVQCDGLELARFVSQDAALNDVAERLRAADPSVPSSLGVRYRGRAA